MDITEEREEELQPLVGRSMQAQSSTFRHLIQNPETLVAIQRIVFLIFIIALLSRLSTTSFDPSLEQTRGAFSLAAKALYQRGRSLFGPPPPPEPISTTQIIPESNPSSSSSSDDNGGGNKDGSTRFSRSIVPQAPKPVIPPKINPNRDVMVFSVPLVNDQDSNSTINETISTPNIDTTTSRPNISVDASQQTNSTTSLVMSPGMDSVGTDSSGQYISQAISDPPTPIDHHPNNDKSSQIQPVSSLSSSVHIADFTSAPSNASSPDSELSPSTQS
jgi:hypothetical protein